MSSSTTTKQLVLDGTGLVELEIGGMTCGHCVSSVTEEVSTIAGVTDVQVELASGALTITSEAPVEETAVKAAVDEAGYELVSH